MSAGKAAVPFKTVLRFVEAKCKKTIHSVMFLPICWNAKKYYKIFSKQMPFVKCCT